MSFTQYGRQLLIGLLFTPDVTVAPMQLEVALTLTVPPTNASMDQLVEPTATEYARQVLALTAAHWAPSNFGDIYNVDKLTYPQVLSGWGVLNGWALVDPVAGQCVNAGALLEPIATVAGMVPYVDPGALMLGIQD